MASHVLFEGGETSEEQSILALLAIDALISFDLVIDVVTRSLIKHEVLLRRFGDFFQK